MGGNSEECELMNREDCGTTPFERLVIEDLTAVKKTQKESCERLIKLEFKVDHHMEQMNDEREEKEQEIQDAKDKKNNRPYFVMAVIGSIIIIWETIREMI